MEGLMVSAFTGALKPLLTKLAAVLEEDYKLLKDAKKDVTFLRDEMSSMNAWLLKMSEKEELNVQEKDWRDKVRELAYDMEDCIDVFMQDLGHGHAKAWHIPGIRTLEARYKFAHLIKGLKDRLLKLIECRNRWLLPQPECSVVLGTGSERALYAAAGSPSALLVGMDGPKEKLVKLLDDGEQRLKVVSLVGFGGVGKTTLAKQVYNAAIKRQKLQPQPYQCSAFVTASRSPDIKIVSDIIRGVGHWVDSSQNDVCQLIKQLRDHLKDKRYLIVIDDIWTLETWNVLGGCFMENNRGGRVITTTRNENVARACRSFIHGHGHEFCKIEPLNYHDSRRLFHRRVFHSEDACPDELNNVSSEILKKCGGVPLAILCVARILLANREGAKWKETWENVLNYLGFHLKTNPHLGLMKHVLNLSYIDLLSVDVDLRACMLYLGIFPEDYEIVKDDLVRRWIAEGFVTEKDGCGPEEIAESYFFELLDRNIIQIAELDDCGEVKSCRVHDLMLEFIISKCTEENFITIMTDLHSTKGSYEVRRLSLQLRNSDLNQVLANMALSQARSFNFWGPAQQMPFLSRFHLLRVVNLDVHVSEAEYNLSCILNLFHLRYLRISGVRCKKLLTQLRKLPHLKILEITDGAYHFGSQLIAGQLPTTLSHLIVKPAVKLTGDIGTMCALRTLATLNLDGSLGRSSVEQARQLGELTNLRELELLCRDLRDEGETSASLVSSLCKLGCCNLRSLTIHDHRWWRHVSFDLLSCWSPPPLHLCRLRVLGCPFSMVPDWIAQLDKLRSLAVQVRVLSTDGIKLLCRLPSLVRLTLHARDHVPRKVSSSAAVFQNLKEFRFRHKVPRLAFEAGAMPSLQSLHVDCALEGLEQVESLLPGFEHLRNLNLLNVLVYENDSFTVLMPCSSRMHMMQKPVRWDMHSLEAFRKSIDKHPENPDINIRFL